MERTAPGKDRVVIRWALAMGAGAVLMLGASGLGIRAALEAVSERVQAEQLLVARQAARRVSDRFAEIGRVLKELALDVRNAEPDRRQEVLRLADERLRSRGASLRIQGPDGRILPVTADPDALDDATHHHPLVSEPRDSSVFLCQQCVVGQKHLAVHRRLADGGSLVALVDLARIHPDLLEDIAGGAAGVGWLVEPTTGVLLAGPDPKILGDSLIPEDPDPVYDDFRNALAVMANGTAGTAHYLWPSEDGPRERFAAFAPVRVADRAYALGVSNDVGVLLALVHRAVTWSATSVGLGVLLLVVAAVATVRRERQRRAESESGAVQAIGALAQALDARDPYTRFHSENVACYAAVLGHWMGLSPEACERLRLAGLLHDLGKIGVCDAILNKPGPLDPEERAAMEVHPLVGAQILGHLPFLEDVTHFVLCHHERMDGRGYPAGLCGAQLPIEARILACADVFDALVTDRPYRQGLPREDVLAILGDMSGPHLDPTVVALVAERYDDLLAEGHGARPQATAPAPVRDYRAA